MVAIYVSLFFPVIELPSKYHWFPVAELEVKVTEPPVQKAVVLPGLINGVAGKGVTVMVPVALSAPQPPVSGMLYLDVPDCVGVPLMVI